MNKEIPIVGFEKWLLTGVGKKCLNAKTLTNEELLKNRLWWAYHAGNKADQVWMTSEVQAVLELLVSSKTITKHLRRRAQYILDNKEDYSITKL